MKSFIRLCGNILCFNSYILLERLRDSIAPIFFYICFSKALPKGENANFACSIICLLLKVNISSPITY